MTDLRRRFMDDMTLHGMAPTTQKVYVHAVKQLAAHYGRSPDQLSEQELRDYFLYLANEKQVASSTLRLQIFAVKFLYTRTLQADAEDSPRQAAAEAAGGARPERGQTTTGRTAQSCCPHVCHADVLLRPADFRSTAIASHGY